MCNLRRAPIHGINEATGHQFVDTGTGFPTKVTSRGFWNYRKTHPICAGFQPFWRDSGQNCPLPAYWPDSIVKKKKKRQVMSAKLTINDIGRKPERFNF
jgi:hypothetical protein